MARAPLNGTQNRIIAVVLRQTYGFNRKKAKLSESYLSAATGIHKQQIKRELKSLINCHVINIVQEATFSTPRVIAFNKNFTLWANSLQVSKKLPDSVLDTSTGSENDTTTGSGLDTQVKTVLKDNIKESPSSGQSPDIPPPKKKTAYDHESAPYKLAVNLSEMIHDNNPDAKQQSEANLQSWARDFDLMERKDHRKPHDIYDVLYWAQNDSFWKSNILSAAKLREQYDRLKLQMSEKR